MSCPLRIGPFGRCVDCAIDELSRGGIRELHVYSFNLGIVLQPTTNIYCSAMVSAEASAIAALLAWLKKRL